MSHNFYHDILDFVNYLIFDKSAHYRIRLSALSFRSLASYNIICLDTYAFFLYFFSDLSNIFGMKYQKSKVPI